MFIQQTPERFFNKLPAWKEGFATLHNFVDATFALAMNEGMVSHQALDMAVLGLLLPDAQ